MSIVILHKAETDLYRTQNKEEKNKLSCEIDPNKKTQICESNIFPNTADHKDNKILQNQLSQIFSFADKKSRNYVFSRVIKKHFKDLLGDNKNLDDTIKLKQQLEIINSLKGKKKKGYHFTQIPTLTLQMK
jgi:hypothetical protein